MGMKVHVLYGKPTDPAAFEEYYRSTHAPIAAKLPGLQSFEYGKSMPNPDGSEAAYFWLATLSFPDAATLGAAMTGPEGAPPPTTSRSSPPAASPSSSASI